MWLDNCAELSQFIPQELHQIMSYLGENVENEVILRSSEKYSTAQNRNFSSQYLTFFLAGEAPRSKMWLDNCAELSQIIPQELHQFMSCLG